MLILCRHETQGFLRFPTTTRPPRSSSSKPLCSPPIVMTLLVIIRFRRVVRIGTLCLIVSPHFAQTCQLLSVPWCSSSPISSRYVFVNDLQVYQTTTRYCYSRPPWLYSLLLFPPYDISLLQNSFYLTLLVSMDSYRIGASCQSISATYIHLCALPPLGLNVLVFIYTCSNLSKILRRVDNCLSFHIKIASCPTLHGYALSETPL